MANFSITVTNAGLALLTGAVAGNTLTFTGIALGSGAYSGSLAAATALSAPKLTLPVSALIKGTGQVTVKGVLTYNTVTTGFDWTEVGLYAADPDGGADILYAYGYAGDKGDYIPSKDEATLTEKVIRLTVMISNAANVTAQIDGSTIYASQEDLEDLEQSVNQSITNIAQVIEQVTGADITGGGEITIDGSMVVTLTHAKEGTVHTFTGLGDRVGLVPCQFKSTAGYTEGDTATIDGTAYIITLTSADDPETDLFVSGKSILVDVDTESKTINFKAGGGLTKAKLALADATEETVFNGRTFYAGADKTLRTGTALAETTNVAPENLFNGKKAYDNRGNLITGAALATPSTVEASDIVSGETAYDNNGNLITGTRPAFNVKTEIILEDKTWTVPAGVNKIHVRLFGGGGSGGNGNYACGGGGGYMATGEFDVTPGQTYPITIGAGGASETSDSTDSSNTGNSGGVTSFGTLLSASGGSGGGSSYCGGAGGSGGGAGGGYGAKGGAGTYGGGGGGGSGNFTAANNANGGKGGTYGGGGGAGFARGTKSASIGGVKGTYGGTGGNSTTSAGQRGVNGTNTTGLALDYTGTAVGGSGGTYGGGGGGGYGGAGGAGATYAGGGGGGYGASGGDAGDGSAITSGGGGGGGYGGAGGAGAQGGGGGGGYGKFGVGGNGSGQQVAMGTGGGYGGMGGSGGIAAGGGGGSDSSGAGGPGICIITYLK